MFTKIASILSRLECGNWDYSTGSFTLPQWEQLLTDIAERNKPMNRINFDSTRLGCISPIVLARGLVNVETLNLQYTDLTQQQVTELFKLISCSCNSLINLDMRWGDLRNVDPTVLASATTNWNLFPSVIPDC